MTDRNKLIETLTGALANDWDGFLTGEDAARMHRLLANKALPALKAAQAEIEALHEEHSLWVSSSLELNAEIEARDARIEALEEGLALMLSTFAGPIRDKRDADKARHIARSTLTGEG